MNQLYKSSVQDIHTVHVAVVAKFALMFIKGRSNVGRRVNYLMSFEPKICFQINVYMKKSCLYILY